MPHPTHFDDQNIVELYKQHEVPLYVYNKHIIAQNINEIKNSLSQFDFTIYYALKANRYPPVVQFIREQGISVDCCSPNEVKLSLKNGFKPNEISFTGNSLSTKELKYLSDLNIHLNLDGISQIKRFDEMNSRTREVGLRIDTATTSRDWSKSVYNNSKFGISIDELPNAIKILKSHKIVTLHLHVAWNMSASKGVEDFENALKVIVKCAKMCPDLKEIDVGGGLGVKFHKNDQESLSPSTWSTLLIKYLKPLNIRVSCELGTKIMCNAGILVSECTTKQVKNNKTWIGMNCGFNLNIYSAHYGIYQDIVNLSRHSGEVEVVDVAGNLNEGIDVFRSNYEMQYTEEGDILAIENCGAYGSSMSSNHCYRGDFKEILL
eukprot:NODE_473_length_7005_cov_0.742977.p3 type:complete len:377 gc:universal NODE_473_length_7005_cov_0.742977:3218-4348(+)